MRRYTQLGEQNGIGGTSHLLEIDGKTIVIDCGGSIEVVSGEDGDQQILVPPAGDYLRGTEVDLLILTHAHLDHLAGVARFVWHHPETPVLMSRNTQRIAEIMIRDTLKIAQNELEAADEEGRMPPPTMVTPREVKHLFHTDQITLVNDKEWLEPWPGWRIGLHPAGHVVGAQSVFIDPPQSGPVFVTGDISAHDQRTLPGVMLPDEAFLGDLLQRPDVFMITVATNGSRDPIRSRAREEQLLIAEMQQILAQGGIALLASFSYGRATEAALICEQAGIVPYVEGMAIKCMKVECPRLIEEQKVEILPRPTNRQEWEKLNAFRRELARGEHGPAVVIAPSGTLNGGFAVQYARGVLPCAQSGIFFLGHIFENSGAERVLQTPRGGTVYLPSRDGHDVPIELRCPVFQHDFTAHDYRHALAERVRRVGPQALLVHHTGEYDGVGGYEGLAVALDERGCSPPRVEPAKHMTPITVD